MRVECDTCRKVYGRKPYMCERCGCKVFNDLLPAGSVSAREALTWDVQRHMSGTIWDEVLDGGAIAGSTILLYGPAGAGKTHEALSLATSLGKRGTISIASSEMPEPRIAEYLHKLGGRLDWAYLHYGISWKRARKFLEASKKPKAIVIDSLQIFAKSVEATRELLRDLHEFRDSVVVLLARVNAAGNISGSNDPAHDADTVIRLTRDAFTVEKHRWAKRGAPYSVKRPPF